MYLINKDNSGDVKFAHRVGRHEDEKQRKRNLDGVMV